MLLSWGIEEFSGGIYKSCSLSFLLRKYFFIYLEQGGAQLMYVNL